MLDPVWTKLLRMSRQYPILSRSNSNQHIFATQPLDFEWTMANLCCSCGIAKPPLFPSRKEGEGGVVNCVDKREAWAIFISVVAARRELCGLFIRRRCALLSGANNDCAPECDMT
ncbi:hypothetical protein ElyMa_001308000 [Elysia marginata]|uniref:Uncharacterized protein n=1 Tax=Elysia marginata TaxID=1093978 RepID=A0AAV4III3_9GAST|nr:hypothetical protein ElyMa_001308000 [Elysia marginata]